MYDMVLCMYNHVCTLIYLVISHNSELGYYIIKLEVLEHMLLMGGDTKLIQNNLEE
jgi:hypothetical protein